MCTPNLVDIDPSLDTKTLKATLAALPVDTLPLHLATTQGGQVAEDSVSFTVLRIDTDDSAVRARVGAFFTEVVGGCNCHDDPYQVNGYCELAVTVDRASGGIRCQLLPG